MSAVLHLTAAGQAEELCSPTFAEDFDVLSGYRAAYAGEFPVVEFKDQVWDFSAVPGVPRWIKPSSIRLNWAAVAEPHWRLLSKELLAAVLCPNHPDVEPLPERRGRPLPWGSISHMFLDPRRWLKWLTSQQVRRLADVRQEHCESFLADVGDGLSPSGQAQLVRVVQEFYRYGGVLHDRYPEGFRPWGRSTAGQVTGHRTSTQNKTPWIPDQVLNPLLAGALFLIGDPAEDLIAAREELLALPTRDQCASSIRALRERLPGALDEYRRRGMPIPASPLEGQPTADHPTKANVSLLLWRAGLPNRNPNELPVDIQALIQDAIAELGLGHGGLFTEISTTTIDGENRPWRDRFAPREVMDMLLVLVGACCTVIAGLSGIRSSELAELEPGCTQRVDLGNGQFRWRLKGRVLKHRGHRGSPEEWTVIEPVARAITVLERLAPAGATHLLSTGLTQYRSGNDGRVSIPNVVRSVVRWQNGPGQAAGLPRIPDVDGRPWPINPRQFRRTLARQLAFQPHGTIAGKIHLKHLQATITEGYWGPPGESAAAFLEEVEDQTTEARYENYAHRFEQWQNGEPLRGGASQKLSREFALLDETFHGSVDLNDQRQRALLRKGAKRLHIGLLNDCHFVDPRQARCLRRQGIDDAEAPQMASCDPAHCAQALVGPEHEPMWRDALLQIDNFLDDRKLPEHERERLKQTKQTYEQVLRTGNGAPDGDV